MAGEKIITWGDLPCLMCGKTANEQGGVEFWKSNSFHSGICENCLVKGFVELMFRKTAQATEQNEVASLRIKIGRQMYVEYLGVIKQGEDGHVEFGSAPDRTVADLTGDPYQDPRG